MDKVVALIGCIEHGPLTGTLSQSDRAALTIATRLTCANCAVKTLVHDDNALAYASAAGFADVGVLHELTTLQFGVLLIGLGALQHCGEWYAGWLAETHEAALLFDVLAVERQTDYLRAVRDLGRGSRETLRLSIPAVLTVSTAAPADYISHYRLWKVRADVTTSPHSVIPIPDPLARYASAWETARPRTKGAIQRSSGLNLSERLADVFSLETSTTSAANEELRSTDPKICAQQILRYLLHHQLIDRDWVNDPATALDNPTVVKSHNATDQVAETPASRICQQFDSPRNRRGPRPLSGPHNGMSRRPRPWSVVSASPAVSVPNKLLRRPRAVGAERPISQRGPFPKFSSTAS